MTNNRAELCQEAGHSDQQLVSLHGSVFSFQCSSKKCTFSDWNYQQRPTVPGLEFLPSDGGELAIDYSKLSATGVPDCPLCKSFKIRPGVHWFGERLPSEQLSRVEGWFDKAPRVDLVLVIGTERSPFVNDAIVKGAEVAWLNYFEEDLSDTGDHWYVDGCVSVTLPYLVEASLSFTSTLDHQQ